MKKFIIFLDIDGVLNKSNQWKYNFRLDNNCIENFAKYVRALEVKNVRIILTSTWKNGWNNAGNHASHIIDLEDKLNKYGLKIYGKTSIDSNGDRAKEINDFILLHKLTEFPCLIIDDDPTIFKTNLLANCKVIFTNHSKGFSLKIKEKKWYEYFKITK